MDLLCRNIRLIYEEGCQAFFTRPHIVSATLSEFAADTNPTQEDAARRTQKVFLLLQRGDTIRISGATVIAFEREIADCTYLDGTLILDLARGMMRMDRQHRWSDRAKSAEASGNGTTKKLL